MFQVRTLSGSLPCRLIVAVQDAAMNRGTVPGDKRNGATRFAQTCNLYIIHLSLNCHAGADMLAEVPRMARLFRRADVRFGSRLCENALEPRTLRIVFSIALCKQQLPVRLIPAATKSRWKFYTQVQRLSFHTAWVKNRQRTGAYRCPLCRQERTFLRTAALRQKQPFDNRSFGNSRMSLLRVHCLTGQIDFPDFPSSKVTATAPIADSRPF
jgi:hypothetical protein